MRKWNRKALLTMARRVMAISARSSERWQLGIYKVDGVNTDYRIEDHTGGADVLDTGWVSGGELWIALRAAEEVARKMLPHGEADRRVAALARLEMMEHAR